MYSCGPRHMDEHRLDGQQESIYSSSVLIQDVAWKIWGEWLMIETSGKRGLGKSVLTTQHDDDIYMVSLFDNKTDWLKCFIINLITNQFYENV